MIRYQDRAKTREEAEEKALQLLLKIAGDVSSVETVTREGKTKEDEDFLYLNVSLKGKPGEPTVYIRQLKKETGTEAGEYTLFFVYDKDKLPFYDKHLSDVQLFLPLCYNTLLKPEKELPVEAVLSPEGRDYLEQYFNHGEELSHEKDVQLFRETPKGLKLFTLFDSFGEMTPQEVKEALEAGDYDGGEKDGERILAEVLGRPIKDEADYLSELSTLCGAGVVKKYSSRLKGGFRFYRLDYSLKYLDYSLRYSEDYPDTQKREAELETKLGKQDGELSRYGGEGFTLSEVALARYLAGYFFIPFVFDGLSPQRLADYLNVPSDTLRKIETSEKAQNCLL